MGFSVFFSADTTEASGKVESFADTIERRITRAIKSLPNIELKADAGDSERKLEELRGQLKELSDKKIGVDIDAATARERIKEISADLVDLAHKTPNVAVAVDAARASSELAAVEREVDKLDGRKAKIDADTTEAEAKVGAFADSMRRRIEAAIHSLPAIDITADSSDADRKIAELRGRLEELANKRVGVDIDAEAAKAEVEEIKAELDDLARKSPNVEVKVDAARASAELAAVQGQVDKLDSAGGGGGGGAGFMLSGIAAAALGVSAALGPAVALLAALPTVGAGAVAGLGAVFAGFSGVGTAVKALDTYQTQQSAGAVSSAAQQVAAANSIASAQDGVRNAITGAADAQRAAGIANVNAARQVADAQRSEGDAARSAAAGVRSALEAQTTAQQSLTSAERQDLTAIQALNDARMAAARQLEDLQAQTEDGALAERRAILDVEKAKTALDVTMANPASTQLQRREAQLAYDEAVQHLSDQQLRNKQLAQDKAVADKAGVEGSKQVVAAQNGVASATTAVANAQRGAADAAANVAEAQRSGAERVATAEEALATARAAQAETARQGLENVAKAQDAVTAAQRSLQGAIVAAGAQGTQALGTLNAAMAQLGPAGQDFARFLHDQMIPQLHGVRDSVQAALLPQLEESLRNLGTLTPIISAGLTGTANVIGDLAVRGSQMMSSGPWRQDFATIMAGNNRALGTFGTAGLSVLDVFRNLAVEAIPLVQRIADMTQHLAAQAQQWIQTKRDTGELSAFFHQAGDELMTILHAFGQVAVAAVQLAQALAPLGLGTVTLVGNLAQLIGLLAKVDPWLAEIAVIGLGLAPIFTRLGSAVGGVQTAFEFLYKGGLTTALEGWALNAGVATEKMVGMAAGSETAAAAGAKVANAGEKAAGAIGKMGQALPIAGVALIALDTIWQSTVTSLDDGTKAMLEGGAAAEQMKNKVNDQLTPFGDWLNSMLHFSATSQDMVDEMHKQVAAMDPLQRSQTLAAQAQKDYLNALSKGPAGAADAIDAQHRYQAATAESTRLQDLLKNGLQDTTAALNAQRDAFLGGLGADIRYRDSIDAVTRSIQQNGVSTDLNTDAGRRNVSAWKDAAQAAVDDIAAMQKQGATQDEINAKIAQHRDQLIATGIQMGWSRDQAIDYVNHLNLVPGQVNTTATLDVREATRILNEWIASAQGRQVILQVSADTSTIAPPRAAGGIDVRPMAGGGFRASVVSANTPTLIGDHPSVPESYIPWDRSARSYSILGVTAAAMGRRVLPMADGGTVGVDTGASADLFAGLTDSAQTLAKAGLKPLADEMTGNTVPALQQVAQAAGQDTPDALKSLTGITSDSANQMGRVWDQLGHDVTGSTDVMRRAMGDWQASHDTAWANITNRSWSAVNEIVGPQFGALHGGLDAIGAHAANTADWWGGQLGRLIPLTGDPIRWSLQYPVNAGLVPAWNAIDRFFALNRPMGQVPVGFAGGSEDHRAQIADPGRPRLWNEPETGGEAYIPLAPAKRAQSSEILGKVAKRFHYNLIPMADGGIIEPYFNDTRRMVGDIAGFFGPGNYPGAMTGLGNAAVAGGTDAANRAMAAAIPVSGGTGVERWRDVGIRALGLAGQPPTKWPRMAMQMGTESGGNPTVVNKWDCLTIDAVILTKRGWLKHDEVQVGDETIGYNPKTGCSEWTRVTRVVHYEDAPLMRLGNSRWHATTTPNHRWLNRPKVVVPSDDSPTVCPYCDWPARRTPPPPLASCPECGWLPQRPGGVPLHRSRIHGIREKKIDYRVQRGGPSKHGLSIHLAKVHGIEGAKSATDYATVPTFVTTEGITGSARLMLAAPAETTSSIDITVQEAAILGWIAGDGHVERACPTPAECAQRGYTESGLCQEHRARQNPSISIGQTKPAMVEKLKALLADVPHALYCYGEKPTRTGKKPCGPGHTFRLGYRWAADLMRRAGHPKHDAVRQVLAMSTEQRAAWLDAMIDAEGTREPGRSPASKERVLISQTYGPILDAIVLAVYLSGRRPRVLNNKVDTPGWSPSALVGVNIPYVTGSYLHKEDAGRGPVWCVTTELGSWTAQEDGHVFLTGNSNWLAGHPSVGLLQLIAGTYHAYIPSQFDVGPYEYGVSVDPLANLLAGTRYTLARYHTLESGWQGHGYDMGGDWPSGTPGFNRSGQTEHVLTGEARAAFLRLVDTLTTHRTASPLTLPAAQITQLVSQAGGGNVAAWGPAITQAVGRAVADAINGAGLRIEDDGHNGIARIVNRQQQQLARR